MSKKVERYPGVYMIMCLSNRKVYIGSSTDTHKRLLSHKWDLRNNRHRSSDLQKDYNVYGHDRFLFVPDLEKINSFNKDFLREREGYWQTVYDAWNIDKGYLVVNAGNNRDVVATSSNRRVIADRWYENTCSPFFLINAATGAVTRETSIRTVLDKLGNGYTKKGIEEALRYWKHFEDGVGRGTKNYKGYIFVRESYYTPEIDYINYKKPRNIRKDSPRLLPGWKEKTPVPMENRALGRKEVIVTLPDGTIQTFRSVTAAYQTLGLKKNKVFAAISAGKKYKGYSFSYTGSVDVPKNS